MNFSVVLNTRKRPMYLDSAITSFIETADNPDLIDFWVRHDDDDELTQQYVKTCLLYTSDAADEGLGVDLGGRRIIKKAD